MRRQSSLFTIIMIQNTHQQIDQSLSGKAVQLKPNYAKVQLHTTHAMVADEKGLIHGGFAFSAADYAAMCAVNDPNVVLAKAQSTFTAPVKLGQTIVFEA
ncbi:MAG: PaaI family thioesterase, partial [Campylobacterota bacterium]|nr:PaaI family thioesterase [Campylobacterota bacterium]